MIYSLRGKLIEKTLDSIVVECGGVGYLCRVSFNTINQMPAVGEEVFVYTKLNIYQDGVALYGFAEKTEKSCFDMLCSVTGVGPKAALSVLSSMTPQQFAMYVAGGDSKAIQAAKGVGKKMADRVILELKDKIKKSGFDLDESDTSGAGRILAASPETEDAVAALMVLGYSENDIRPYLSNIKPGMDTSSIIKAVLKMIGNNKR